MNDEKTPTPMLVPPVAKDQGVQAVSEPECPGCVAKNIKPPTFDVAVKAFPTPAGTYMAMHFCKWCGYVYSCQLMTGELLGQESRIAPPSAGGPLDPRFNPSRRGG